MAGERVFKLQQEGEKLVLTQLEGPKMDLNHLVKNNRFFMANMISQRAKELQSGSPKVYPLVDTGNETRAHIIATKELTHVGITILDS